MKVDEVEKFRGEEGLEEEMWMNPKIFITFAESRGFYSINYFISDLLKLSNNSLLKLKFFFIIHYY